jgi:dihydrofolate reductase
MTINAILACDEEGGVSKDGTMPWPHNSTDLQWFKENTAGHVVVMGSTTWNASDMPKPLPKRINILVTSKVSKYSNCGADSIIQGDLNTHLKALKNTYPGLKIWIIGGPDIIKQTLESIDQFYLSRIPGKYNCDTFLPLDEIESTFKRVWLMEHEEVNFEVWRNHEAVS